MSGSTSDGSGSGWFSNLFGGGGSSGGSMTPAQMYAMSLLSQGNRGGGTGWAGGMANGLSPIMQALMMRGVMGQGQQPQQMNGFAPAMQPGQAGTGGFVAPIGPAVAGYSGSGAGAIGGGNPMFSGGGGAAPAATNPYLVAPSPAGASAQSIGPNQWGF